MPGNKPVLVLASQSRARGEMLRNAGLVFETAPASLDETALMKEMQQKKLPPHKIADELARKKALAVGAKFPDALVIGADQILECDGALVDKANSPQEALEKLKMLRGKTHRLVSAVAVAKAGTVFWSHHEEAQLSMHEFDDAFLEKYCAKAGQALTASVGAYELEGLGAQLFTEVKGDYFAILGLPLLTLLGYLREYHGVGL